MSKKLLSVRVRGNYNHWVFNFYGDPKHLADWRRDGLDVDEVVNTIPAWVSDIGCTRAWVFLQDIFQFRNPW